MRFLWLVLSIAGIFMVPKLVSGKKAFFSREGRGVHRGCPQGWSEFQSFCYQASSSITSWSTAQFLCEARGGNLVKITSAPENDFVLYLSRKFAPQRQQMWIGLGYWSSDRKYHWRDGSLPRYTNWASGEPNGFESEPCGHMWTDLKRKHARRLAGTWNDGKCGKLPALCGFVCEKLK